MYSLYFHHVRLHGLYILRAGNIIILKNNCPENSSGKIESGTTMIASDANIEHTCWNILLYEPLGVLGLTWSFP